MKLLYITTRISGAGGMQRVLSVKTNYLADKGYEISILTTNADKEDVMYDFNKNINFHTISPDRKNYFFSYKNLLKKTVEKIGPDIIIICDNGLKGFLLPLFFGKKYKLVYERHGSKYLQEKFIKPNLFWTYLNKFRNFYMDYWSGRFDEFVVLTYSAKEEWNNINTVVIPNPLWFDALSSPLINKIAIAVGRHTYEKGYDRMFEIWSRVLQKHPDWLLKVYGDFNEAIDLRELARHYKISANVQFFPSTKNIIETYKDASILVMTSRYEGFGMVLIEAMACGVPCVAYDCPVGPSDIIKDGFNGYLVKDGDSNTFTDRLSLMIEDEKHRQELGIHSKDSVERFDLENIMNRWESLFKTLTTK